MIYIDLNLCIFIFIFLFVIYLYVSMDVCLHVGLHVYVYTKRYIQENMSLQILSLSIPASSPAAGRHCGAPKLKPLLGCPRFRVSGVRGRLRGSSV